MIDKRMQVSLRFEIHREQQADTANKFSNDGLRILFGLPGGEHPTQVVDYRPPVLLEVLEDVSLDQEITT